MFEESQGTSFLGTGKLHQAQYFRLRKALAAAAASGWTLRPGPIDRYQGELVTLADKQLPTGPATMGLTLLPRGDPGEESTGPHC